MGSSILETKSKDVTLIKSLLPSESDNSFLDIKGYKVAIENLAADKNPKKFKNSSAEHASIVFGNIFNTATDHVKIYAGNFSGEISNTDYYIDNLSKLLSRNVPISVIFQKSIPTSKSLAFIKLKEFIHSNKIALYKLNTEKENEFRFHFTVADGRMYRIELSDNFDAECCFNDPITAKRLEQNFAYLSVNSTQITE